MLINFEVESILTARHWVDKNCLPWTKEYLNENVVNTSVENDSYTFSVTRVETSGDCDVTQRKGKVLCIYDMKLLFTVGGTKKDEEKDILATIVLEEFVHDQDEDEYIFDITSDVASDIKKHLIPVLRAKLMKFQNDLIEAHEKDVQHTTGH